MFNVAGDCLNTLMAAAENNSCQLCLSYTDKYFIPMIPGHGLSLTGGDTVVLDFHDKQIGVSELSESNSLLVKYRMSSELLLKYYYFTRLA